VTSALAAAAGTCAASLMTRRSGHWSDGKILALGRRSGARRSGGSQESLTREDGPRVLELTVLEGKDGTIRRQPTPNRAASRGARSFPMPWRKRRRPPD